MLSYTELEPVETKRMLWLGVPSYLFAVFISQIVLNAGGLLSFAIFVMVSVVYSYSYSKLFVYAAAKRLV